MASERTGNACYLRKAASRLAQGPPGVDRVAAGRARIASGLDHPREPHTVFAGQITIEDRADGAHQHLAALSHDNAVAQGH